jgi:hypothetical protein
MEYLRNGIQKGILFGLLSCGLCFFAPAWWWCQKASVSSVSRIICVNTIRAVFDIQRMLFETRFPGRVGALDMARDESEDPTNKA